MQVNQAAHLRFRLIAEELLFWQMKADNQSFEASPGNARQTFEENRRAFERVRMELNKLRRQMCDTEENMAALDNIIEELRERRKQRPPPKESI